MKSDVILYTFMCIHMHNLLALIQVQLAKTQWILIVDLYQFHNLFNAEMANSEEVCCCDSTEKCAVDADDLQGCSADCDIWFDVYVTHCTQPYQCSFSTFTSVDYDTALIDNLKNRFFFILNASSDTVSVNS